MTTNIYIYAENGSKKPNVRIWVTTIKNGVRKNCRHPKVIVATQQPLLCACEAIQIVRDLCLETGHEVAVQVHRDRDRGVTHTFLNDLRLFAELNEDRSVGVAQVVEGYLRTGRLAQPCSLLINFIHSPADKMSITIDGVRFAGTAAADIVGDLRCSFERVNDELRQSHRAAGALGLRLFGDAPARACLRLSPEDGHRAASEVDGGPQQSCALLAP